MRKLSLIPVLLVALAFISIGLAGQPPVPGDPGAGFLAFVRNEGQWRPEIRFVARRGGMAAQIETGALVLRGRGISALESTTEAVVRLAFERANRLARIEGRDRHLSRHNFFLGSDPRRWRSHVPAFASILYRELYAGIDVRVREGAGGLVEYDVIAAPGADLDQFVVRCEGDVRLVPGADGSLALHTPFGRFRMKPPVSWEETPDGRRHPIAGSFRLLGPRRFGFAVRSRCPERRLVIDPGLEWATYLGGKIDEFGNAVAVTAKGEVLVAGGTFSSDFPTTGGAFDRTIGSSGVSDVFVSKFSKDGKSLLWSTYLGGSAYDIAFGVGVDKNDNVYVAGSAHGTGFPVTKGAFDTTHNGGQDAFAAKLSADGSKLIWATYLGGTGTDSANGMAVDASGVVTVVGPTHGQNYPVTLGAYDISHNGKYDIFVTRVAADGSTLVWSTFLGSSGDDIAQDVALGPNGTATVAGTALSTATGFPTTSGAFDTTHNGSNDAVLARISADGKKLVWSTFLGTSGVDASSAVTVDAAGVATIVGGTSSGSFPVTKGVIQPNYEGGRYDLFVSRVAADGKSLVWSTLLGGSSDDAGRGVGLDANGGVVVGGYTSSTDFPTTRGAFDRGHNGSADTFAVRISPDGQSLYYGTLFGGSSQDEGRAMAVSPAGAAVVAGATTSSNLPATTGAYDTTANGSYDAFVARFDLLPKGVSRYGAATAGVARTPTIAVTSVPLVGNSRFALTGGGAPPSSGGVLAFALRKRTTPFMLLGAAIWIDPFSNLAAMPASSNAQGGTNHPFPIPNVPALRGQSAYLQFAWPDAGAPKGLSASPGLKVSIQ